MTTTTLPHSYLALSGRLESTPPKTISPFQPKVGCLVNVEPRTWPGINKHGGVGWVTAVHSDGTNNVTHVDVKYALQGSEKNVDINYVREHTFEEDEKASERPSRRRKTPSPSTDCQDKTTVKKPGKKPKRNTKISNGKGTACDKNIPARKKSTPKAKNNIRKSEEIPEVTPSSSEKLVVKHEVYASSSKNTNLLDFSTCDSTNIANKGDVRLEGSQVKKFESRVNSNAVTEIDCIKKDEIVNLDNILRSKGSPADVTPMPHELTKKHENPTETTLKSAKGKPNRSQVNNDKRLSTKPINLNELQMFKNKAAICGAKPNSQVRSYFSKSSKIPSVPAATKNEQKPDTCSTSLVPLQDRSYLSIEETMERNWSKAEDFVNEVVGKKKENDSEKDNGKDSACSSPQSTCSSQLEIKGEEERAKIFNEILSKSPKFRREGCVQVDAFRMEINKEIDPGVKTFSTLEVHTLLKRLEKRDKIMVTWDTNTIYKL